MNNQVVIISFAKILVVKIQFMSILNITTRLISYLLHPLLLVSYTFVYLMWVDPFAYGAPSFETAIGTYDVVLIRIFISTAMLPLISILIMKFLGMLETFEMEDKQERIGPYIATSVFYLWIFFSTKSNPQLPDGFKIFMLGATLALFIAFFVNNFSKISIYAVGLGSIVGMVLMNLSLTLPATFQVLQIVIVLAGLLGTARLFLKSTRIIDVFGGYFAGFVAQFIAMALLIAFG